jgi:hypothetical protein
MAEELGKIEKPLAENYKAGRKLYFVPLIFTAPDLPLNISLKFSTYWDQVETQISSLEAKLGPVKYVLHELLSETGEAGLKSLEQLNNACLSIIRNRIEKGATLETAEDADTLTELMDWSRCLSLGIQNKKVFSTIYQNYTDSNNKRNEAYSQKIDNLVKGDESCVVIMGEGHHVKFPADMQVFYIAPPALDEIKRWIREEEAKEQAKQDKQAEQPSQPEK